jgi:osmotically-inducible protein OsmY
MAVGKLIRNLTPIGRVGMALWAWNNRDELARWAGFAITAGPRVAEGNVGDVLTEARLRARLTADSRTRGAEGLRLEVHDGVATLSGIVEPKVHDVALDLATSTAGITRVRDELAHPKASKFAFAPARS